MPSRDRERSILPLPEHVIAQIKSSTAIVSLTGVVLDLLKNALDAGATKVDATVDWARGGCSVEDNGLGIQPFEFRQDGGLGKLHCTSKYSIHADEAYFGCNGTFLASLAAMSLLTITSHHHEHRSHNSITFHQSKTLDRQLPVPPQHEVGYDAHGTRVTVRNLFGNLPVRVKQRAVDAESKVEHDKLREILKRNIIGLMLGWRQPVSVKVRDAENQVILQISRKSEDVKGTGGTQPSSTPLHAMLNLLTQAGFLSIVDWDHWVPAAASTATLSIKGAISLEPCPTKRVQFISLGIRPLFAENGHNALYNEVNRLFNLSSFGTVEDDDDVDQREKIRRQSDKRFKSEGYTNRQLRGRKGTDRYPMFYLRIQAKDHTLFHGSEDHLLENDANLQSIVDVLGALLTQWLSTHHFRPQHLQRRRKQAKTPMDFLNNGDISKFFTPDSLIEHRADIAASSRASSTSTSREKRKRKRSTYTQLDAKPESTQQIPFRDWSRIKSGKAEFYQNLWVAKKPTVEGSSSHELIHSPPVYATFNAEPIPPGAFSEHFHPAEEPKEIETRNLTRSSLNGTNTDETIPWFDTTTRQTFLLNARTGGMVPEHTTRPQSDNAQVANTNTLRLQPRPATASLVERPFLDGVLSTWDNPIFKPSEKQIHQILLDEHRYEDKHIHSCIDIQKAFAESSHYGKSKLSKNALQHAQVISQLDKKFILVKTAHENEKGRHVLVLIDQHAADERIRVETLLIELCTPLTDQPQYRSNLGHSSRVAYTVLEKPLRFSISAQEHEILLTHAERFGSWGILFDLPGCSAMAVGKDKPGHIISVTTLPPSIAERCKANPKLLISFLRSAAWKYTETSHLPSLPNQTIEPTQDNKDGMPSWVRQLSSCPDGLIEFVNSRACRSAIMFNDELRPEECKELVEKLAGCVFPFMCAHGRPSMVPLVDLGTACASMGLGIGSAVDEHMGNTECGNFVDTWKKWRAKRI